MDVAVGEPVGQRRQLSPSRTADSSVGAAGEPAGVLTGSVAGGLHSRRPGA